jgi:hypothetical protein
MSLSNGLLASPSFAEAMAKQGPGPHVTGANTIFTATDMRVVVNATFKSGRAVVPYPVLLDTVAGLSFSEHRDVFPVRKFGRSGPGGWAYGARTIAGTVIFAQFGEYGIRDIISAELRNRKLRMGAGRRTNVSDGGNAFEIASLTDLPPVNLDVTFINETGAAATTGLVGVKFLDEGESFTMDDAEWFSSVSYVAQSKLPMTPVQGSRGAVRTNESFHGFPELYKLTGKVDFFTERWYNRVKSSVNGWRPQSRDIGTEPA